MVKDGALVAIEHRLHDLAGAADAAVGKPEDEVGEVVAAVLDRLGRIAANGHRFKELLDQHREARRVRPIARDHLR